MRQKRLRGPRGVTLLEALLVIVVATSISLLGIRMYKGHRTNADIEEVKYTINTLFQAMNSYYLANCGRLGTLGNSATSSNFVTTIAALQPYLPSNWRMSKLISTLIIQFNPRVINNDLSTSACVVLTPGTACTPIAQPIASSQGQIFMWQAQIAFQLTNSSYTNAFSSALGATCRVSLVSASASDPCTVNVGGDYLVFQRPAKSGFSNARLGGPTNSALWLTTPQLKQFNLEYSHDLQLEINGNYSVPQNYLCGG